MKARTVVGRGEKSSLGDPGSELRTTGRKGESSAKIINGMQKNIKEGRRRPKLIRPKKKSEKALFDSRIRL